MANGRESVKAWSFHKFCNIFWDLGIGGTAGKTLQEAVHLFAPLLHDCCIYQHYCYRFQVHKRPQKWKMEFWEAQSGVMGSNSNRWRLHGLYGFLFTFIMDVIYLHLPIHTGEMCLFLASVWHDRRKDNGSISGWYVWNGVSLYLLRLLNAEARAG